MRKTFVVTLIILVSLCLSISFLVSGQEASQEASFSRLTFKVSAEKQEVLPFEPIAINLSLTNETSAPVLGHSRIDFVTGPIRLLVKNDKGEVKQIEQLSIKRVKLPRISNTPIAPGQGYQSRGVFFNLHSAFQEPGIYEIQAILKDMNGGEEVRSNPVTITIVEPAGAELQAYNLVKEKINGNQFFFEGHITRQQEDEKILEQLSDRFGDTLYGGYASYFLGVKQQVKGNLELAESYLQRAAGRDDLIFKAQAVQELNRISEQKAKIRQQ